MLLFVCLQSIDYSKFHLCDSIIKLLYYVYERLR